MSEETPTWLVTGGAGYIGAHVTRTLLSAGLRVVVIDNLSTGLIERIPDSVTTIRADCADHQTVHEVLVDHEVVGVMHLAAFKQARESAREPMKYWVNNVNAILGVLRAIEGTPVRHFVLSSSCSVYGAAGPVGVSSIPRPMSPYARTKYANELMLQDLAPHLGLSTVTLRYFNVIGNDDFAMAHDTSIECLVPSAYTQVVRDEPIRVFGTSHPTPDGTALRDYVDVRDLADAHLKAAQYLMNHGPDLQLTLDVGTGVPASVTEVLHALQEATGRTVVLHDAGAHPADPAAVWAEASSIRTLLDWTPRFGLLASVAAHVVSVGGTPRSERHESQ